MRSAWTGLLLLGCGAAPQPPPMPPAAVALPGRWRVEATTFPMWLEGPRQCPVLSYQPGETPGTLIDEVHFLRDGVPGTIAGTDTRDPADPLHLTWRGEGWMRVLRSDWYIRAAGEGWMVIYFERTALSPAGMDVVSREGRLVDWAGVDAAVAADPLLAPLQEALTRLDRTDCPEPAAPE